MIIKVIKLVYRNVKQMMIVREIGFVTLIQKFVNSLRKNQSKKKN